MTTLLKQAFSQLPDKLSNLLFIYIFRYSDKKTYDPRLFPIKVSIAGWYLTFFILF